MCLLVCVLVVAGCAASGPGAPVDADAPRERLGEPMVALAVALGRTTDTLDRVRHRVERGEPMRDALLSLKVDISELSAGVVRARRAIRRGTSQEAQRNEPAVRLLRETADRAGQAAVAADEEAAFFARLAVADRQMERAIRSWDQPGALAGVEADLDRVIAELRALTPVPASCPGPVERRIEWARVLAERTRALADDPALAGPFRRDPFGEDRRVADSADRDCWQSATVVLELEREVRQAAERLAELLKG